MQYQTLNNLPQPRTLLLKGPPGSGKTTIAAQLPKVVIFNFDNNLAALQKMPLDMQKEIKIISPKKGLDHKTQGSLIWSKFIEQLEEVVQDNNVTTIVIDSLTTLTECLMDFIVGSSMPNVQPEIQHWGTYSRYLKWLGDSFLCVDGLDKNIVIIAHEQTIMDSLEKQVKYTLNIGSRMKDSFELYFTDCWRLSTKGLPNQNPRFLVGVVPTNLYSAKCSIPGLPPESVFKDKKDKICQIFRDSIPSLEPTGSTH
jgi:hypothetical protein